MSFVASRGRFRSEKHQRARPSVALLGQAAWVALVGLVVASASCGVEDEVFGMGGGAEALRVVGFTSWTRSLPHEPGTAFAIVEQDLVLGGDAALRAYYEREVSPSRKRSLTVDRVGGYDDLWPGTMARALSYCVADSFGAAKPAVVAAMRAAAASWEAAADVLFVYMGREDGRCTSRNGAVVFDVRPSTARSYLARSFFPSSTRAYRTVMVTPAARSIALPLSLAGILRHELGHVLGLRHEHTRPEAGVCYEDAHWRPVTPYDRASVMHYPQCNGSGDWSGTLTAFDRAGIATLYGAPRALH